MGLRFQHEAGQAISSCNTEQVLVDAPLLQLYFAIDQLKLIGSDFPLRARGHHLGS
jgi:hypothetical protein